MLSQFSSGPWEALAQFTDGVFVLLNYSEGCVLNHELHYAVTVMSGEKKVPLLPVNRSKITLNSLLSA